jgi:hypothetical protein
VTRTVKAKGGDENVKVITDAGCSWSATSNVPWVQIKGAASGTGSRDLKYEVERNQSGFPRFGTLSIGGATHVITQGADD